MSVSHDTRAPSRDTRVLPGDLGATGGAVPIGGDRAAAGAEGGSEESAGESEAWAAAVPPVRLTTNYNFVCKDQDQRTVVNLLSREVSTPDDQQFLIGAFLVTIIPMKTYFEVTVELRH